MAPAAGDGLAEDGEGDGEAEDVDEAVACSTRDRLSVASAACGAPGVLGAPERCSTWAATVTEVMLGSWPRWTPATATSRTPSGSTGSWGIFVPPM